jgi:hypothetical protein
MVETIRNQETIDQVFLQSLYVIGICLSTLKIAKTRISEDSILRIFLNKPGG